MEDEQKWIAPSCHKTHDGIGISGADKRAEKTKKSLAQQMAGVMQEVIHMDESTVTRNRPIMARGGVLRPCFAVVALVLQALALFAVAQDPLLTLISVTNPPRYVVDNAGYFVDLSSATEARVYRNGHHYLSVLTGDGIFAIRPHPGEDIDGWGSTLYLQPFFAGATLHHTTNVSIEAVNEGVTPGVRVSATGSVSQGANATYGDWSATFDLICSNKMLTAKGTYEIQLAGLTNVLGDLNFFKIASNFLRDVPVVTGATTNTGDMEYVVYDGPNFPLGWERPLTWNPAISSAHFPGDDNSWLSVDVLGSINEVDAARQGYLPIMPAHKPRLKVILHSQNEETLRFGALYNVSQSAWFWADNVGVTPWAPASSTATNYEFALTIESEALPGDHYAQEVSLQASGLQRQYYGIFFTRSLTNAFARMGSIVWTNGQYEGKTKVENPGFFQVRREY